MSISRRPFVIQCGAKKLVGVHRVGDLYLGPLWGAYRGALRADASLPFAVYVLSARFGLAHVDVRVPSYNAVIERDPRGKANAVSMQHVANLVQCQLTMHPGVFEVDFVGSSVYMKTLQMAGVIVYRLESRGIGYMAAAVKRHVAEGFR